MSHPSHTTFKRACKWILSWMLLPFIILLLLVFPSLDVGAEY